MGRTTKSTSSIATKYFCSVPDCSESFVKLGNLERHRKNVHDAKKVEIKVRCDVDGCGKEFRKRKQLYDHKFMVHNEEQKQKHACIKCSAKFALPSKLKLHMKRHEGYRCPECEFQAETWSAMRRHKADVHPVRHTCDQCGKMFSKMSVLKKHQRVHEKMVKCPEASCDMKVLPWKMARHVKTAHAHLIRDGRQVQIIDGLISSVLRNNDSTSPTYRCSQCSKKFAKERNLRLHQRCVHEKSADAKQRILTFSCIEIGCTSRFSTDSKLQDHLNWHQGIQPFQCPEQECSAKFTTRSALQRHVKWKHMKLLCGYDLPRHLAVMCQRGEETDSDQTDNMESDA